MSDIQPLDKRVHKLNKFMQSVYRNPLIRKFYEPYWHRPIGMRELVYFPHRERYSRVDINGKLVFITGASSGMGRASAIKLAQLGAKIVAVARRENELQDLQKTIEEGGGQCAYYPLDLTDQEATDTVIQQVLQQHGVPDIVINNAGHSIRRSVKDSLDRFHDYTRTMNVNYYPAVQITLGFLPGMMERRSGHFINISSWGVPLHAVPLFSAYLASKSALTAFTRSIELDTRDRGIRATVVYPPLVRTEMIAPTKEYENLQTLSVDEASDWIVYAAKNQPREVIPRLVRYVRFLFTVHPGLGEVLASNAWT